MEMEQANRPSQRHKVIERVNDEVEVDSGVNVHNCNLVADLWSHPSRGRDVGTKVSCQGRGSLSRRTLSDHG